MPMGPFLAATPGFRFDTCGSACGVLSLAVISLAWLGVAARRTTGSTLRAPIIWSALAIMAVLIVELSLQGSTTAAARNFRYLAAIGTFCPSMALLGAKRPQDRGWQFVVATLWVVLALPALQSLVFAPHSQANLHPAWQWFLAMLIAVGVANYLPTRYALSALLVGLAQFLLLHEFTPVPWSGSPPSAVLIALGLLAIATSLVGCSWPRPTRAANFSDRVWRDFRDGFGVVWSLRVMERINQAAGQNGTHLDWQGFRDGGDPLQCGGADALGNQETTIRMLLRRFVSPDWIARRQPTDTN